MQFHFASNAFATSVEKIASVLIIEVGAAKNASSLLYTTHPCAHEEIKSKLNSGNRAAI
jgi:hypothetical protein